MTLAMFMAIETATGLTPFFTNDWEGLLKLILALGAVAVSIVGFIWRVMRSDLQAKDKELERQAKQDKTELQTEMNEQHRETLQLIGRLKDQLTLDLNSLGSRVNEVRSDCTKTAAEIQGVIRQVDKTELDVKHMHEGFGEMRATLDNLREVQTEKAQEIISHIQQGQLNVMQATGQTNERIAGLEGQVKLMGDLLSKRFQNLLENEE